MKPSGTRSLDVWMNGERVGSWTRRARGEQWFAYAESWLSASESRPISLSLPLAPSAARISGPEVESFFDNLLPDNADIRRRIQRRYACSSDSPFDLLSEIGRDCVGALQLLPEGSPAPSARKIEAEPLDEAGVANLLRSVTADALPGSAPDESFRISIAGAQEKTALLFHGGSWCRPLGSTPTSHLFKLPLGNIGAERIDMSRSIENEWLCLKLLGAFGLDVAVAEIADFEDQRVLIVERFDRRLSADGSWWISIPQEDLCQATGTPPSRKYESEGGPGIAALTRLLLGARDPLSDRRKFLKAQILFWLLAAPDGHAKNFSLFLEREGRFSLTPLYDVMSVHPLLGHGTGKLPPEKLRMAMAVSGTSRHYEWEKIRNRHWESTAKACGAERVIAEVLDEIRERLPAAIERTKATLPADFPARVAESIFKGVKATAERGITP